jgi:hypothetical protein
MVYSFIFLLLKKVVCHKVYKTQRKNFVFVLLLLRRTGSQSFFCREGGKAFYWEEGGVWFCCAKHCTLQTLERPSTLNEPLQPFKQFSTTFNLQLSTFNFQPSTPSLLLRRFLFHFHLLRRTLRTLYPCLFCLTFRFRHPLVI